MSLWRRERRGALRSTRETLRLWTRGASGHAAPLDSGHTTPPDSGNSLHKPQDSGHWTADTGAGHDHRTADTTHCRRPPQPGSDPHSLMVSGPPAGLERPSQTRRPLRAAPSPTDARAPPPPPTRPPRRAAAADGGAPAVGGDERARYSPMPAASAARRRRWWRISTRREAFIGAAHAAHGGKAAGDTTPADGADTLKLPR